MSGGAGIDAKWALTAGLETHQGDEGGGPGGSEEVSPTVKRGRGAESFHGGQVRGEPAQNQTLLS